MVQPNPKTWRTSIGSPSQGATSQACSVFVPSRENLRTRSLRSPTSSELVFSYEALQFVADISGGKYLSSTLTMTNLLLNARGGLEFKSLFLFSGMDTHDSSDHWQSIVKPWQRGWRSEPEEGCDCILTRGPRSSTRP